MITVYVGPTQACPNICASETSQQRVIRLLNDRQGHQDQHALRSVQSRNVKYLEYFSTLHIALCFNSAEACPIDVTASSLVYGWATTQQSAFRDIRELKIL